MKKLHKIDIRGLNYRYKVGDYILYERRWFRVVSVYDSSMEVEVVKLTLWERGRSLYHRALASI